MIKVKLTKKQAMVLHDVLYQNAGSHTIDRLYNCSLYRTRHVDKAHEMTAAEFAVEFANGFIAMAQAIADDK